jgi:hypothetical protein
VHALFGNLLSPVAAEVSDNALMRNVLAESRAGGLTWPIFSTSFNGDSLPAIRLVSLEQATPMDSYISNVVDPEFTIVAKMRTRYLGQPR